MSGQDRLDRGEQRHTLGGDAAFRSWPRVLTGAVTLGALFGVAQVLSELVLTGDLVIGRATLGLSGLAFWGYVLVSIWIRRNPATDRP